MTMVIKLERLISFSLDWVPSIISYHQFSCLRSQSDGSQTKVDIWMIDHWNPFYELETRSQRSIQFTSVIIVIEYPKNTTILFNCICFMTLVTDQEIRSIYLEVDVWEEYCELISSKKIRIFCHYYRLESWQTVD